MSVSVIILLYPELPVKFSKVVGVFNVRLQRTHLGLVVWLLSFLEDAVLLVSHVFPTGILECFLFHRNADAKPRFFFGRKAIHFIFI